MRKTCFLLLFFAIQNCFSQDLTLKQALQIIQQDTLTSTRIISLEKELQATQNHTLKIEGFTALGKAYYSIERYDKAMEFYNEGLLLAKKYNIINDLGTLNEGLGNLHFKLGNYEKCDTFYHASLHYFKQLKNSVRVNKAKGNLAILNIKKGNFDQALVSLNVMLNEDLDAKSKAIVYSNIGNVYLEKKTNLDLAIVNYKKAIELLEVKQHGQILASVYQNLAECFIIKNDLDEALYNLEKSELLLKDYNDTELRAALYKFYATVYESKSNFKYALKYQKLFFHENIKVEQSKNKWLIENKEISNQLKNNEIEQENIQHKINILKTEKSLATVKVYLLILAFLLLCLVVYVVLKKQRHRISVLNHSVIASKDKLKFTEDKAEKIILNVNHTQDIMQQFTSQIKKLYTECGDENTRKKLLEILQDIQYTKIPSQKNEELLQTLTSSFIFNLEKKHPDLTDEERKIAELIFLGYKNKEIATLLNLSVRSIENCRYRIRKKINIDTNMSLSVYLQTFSQQNQELKYN